jgi:hypothetical protein
MSQCNLTAAQNLRLIFRYLTIVGLFVLQPYKINNCHYNSLYRPDIGEYVATAVNPSRGFLQLSDCRLESQDQAYGVIVQRSEKPPDVLARGAVQLSLADCDLSMSAFYA